MQVDKSPYKQLSIRFQDILKALLQSLSLTLFHINPVLYGYFSHINPYFFLCNSLFHNIQSHEILPTNEYFNTPLWSSKLFQMVYYKYLPLFNLTANTWMLLLKERIIYNGTKSQSTFQGVYGIKLPSHP